MPEDYSDFVGSSHGWLALFDRSNNAVFLSDLISRRHIKLPQIKTLPISKSRLKDGYECVSKVIISSSSPDKEECRAMDDVIVFDHDDVVDDVSNDDDDEISEEGFLVIDKSSDELYFVRRYVMDRMGPDGDPVEEIYYGPVKGYKEDNIPCKTVGFGVYRYVDGDRGFKNMDTLDGLVLFIGLNHGFVLRGDEFPELKPDSVYFTDTDSLPDLLENTYGGHDLGIFNYKDCTFSPCYYPCDYESIQRIEPSPMWFTPNHHHPDSKENLN